MPIRHAPTKAVRSAKSRKIRNSASDIDAAVGARVKSRRIQLGMSQTTLADELGITFQQVQKYEKGKNRISSSRLQHIADFLGVAAAYFFEDPLERTAEGRSVSLQEFNVFLASRDGVALMRAFPKIKSRKLRQAISNFVADLDD